MSTPAILQQLNGASRTPNLQPIKQMMNMVRNARNPQAMLQMMAQSNPQLQQTLALVEKAGNDPRKAFYALAEQKGINPQEILDALK